MADLPGGASGCWCARYKGKEADRLVTRTTPAWSRWSPNCAGHERQAAEESEQWKTRVEERKILAASPGRSRSPCC